MAQLSIRVGSPAVCSPASCFTAIKYHQGRGKESGGGRAGKRRRRAVFLERKEAQERGTNWWDGYRRDENSDEEIMRVREVCVTRRGGAKRGAE